MAGRRSGPVGSPPPVTLRDVARETGVSINTVSRALTGKSDINSGTKLRIQATAKRLGYQPNLPARSLVLGRTRSLGLIVSDCANPFYAKVIQAVEDVASHNGYGLLLATSSESAERESSTLQMLRERRIDGLLLSPVMADASHLRSLIEGTLPYVLLTRHPAAYKGPFVGTDNVRAAKLAVHHLLELGHRRIAHLTWAQGGVSARARLHGYRREMAEAGLPRDRQCELSAEQTIAGGRAAVRPLLDQYPRPTAIFTYNDLQAIGMILGLSEVGIAVPEEMSVVGFDGIDFGELVTPRLTTMSQQIDRIARLAAQMLLEMLATRSAGRQHVLPAALVVRGSSAPPCRQA